MSKTTESESTAELVRNEMSEKTSASDTPWRFLTREETKFSLRNLVYTLAVFALVLSLAAFTKSLLRSRIKMPSGIAQPNYLSPLAAAPAANQDVLAWYEFGKNAQLLTTLVSPPEPPLERSANNAYSSRQVGIQPQGFSIGRQWTRDISWHAKADNHAELKLQIPSSFNVSYIGLYMTDGDSHWRSSRVYSRPERQQILAERLHGGKWIFFPLTAGERAAGRKRLRFEQLTGDNIAVSALVLLTNKREPSAPSE